MNSQERKEYQKAYYEAHKEQLKAQMKAWKEAHKETEKAKLKAWKETNKERVKAWCEANKEKAKAYQKAYKQANKEKVKAYMQSDVNSLGQTKQSIRQKSLRILKKMNLKIPRYEIHHAFGYEDASKFIYISKSLHSKIHKYLREHNIDADSDHWLQISDIVNSTYEFIYIKS